MQPDASSLFAPLKNMRLTPQERADAWTNILEATATSERNAGTLSMDEHATTLRELCSFIDEFPHRQHVHTGSISFAVWQGGNFFRHVQPFFLTSHSSHTQ